MRAQPKKLSSFFILRALVQYMEINRSRFLASRGYVYAVQDVRGRGDSDGRFYPLVTEADNGDDAITWLAPQAWSNGRVGMTGGSYLGWVQVLAATKNNPHLAALNPATSPGQLACIVRARSI